MLAIKPYSNYNWIITFIVICRALLGQTLNTSDPEVRQRTYSRVLKLGLITPPDGKLGFTRVAAATTMAIEQAHRDGHLVDTDIRYVTNVMDVA